MGDKKVVVFKDTEFPVTPKMYETMMYFQESEAITDTNRHIITIFEPEIWLKMTSILDSINYKFLKMP